VLVAVIDTATPAVIAAVAFIDPAAAGTTGARILAERQELVDVSSGRAHGELLAPAVAAVLADAGIGPRDLTALVAGIGPGPFTGLRAGLATAQAMADALAVPTYGVCSLDGIGVLTTPTTLVATDARRKEIYWAIYRDGMALTGPAVDRPSR
jgi:tRNA threonylcarbamoyl adenosine modification protein YeaZ